MRKTPYELDHGWTVAFIARLRQGEFGTGWLVGMVLDAWDSAAIVEWDERRRRIMSGITPE